MDMDLEGLRDTSESQYAGVPTASVDLAFNLICRRIIADVAVKLHDVYRH